MTLKNIRIRKLRVDQREETWWQLSNLFVIFHNSDTWNIGINIETVEKQPPIWDLERPNFVIAV